MVSKELLERAKKCTSKEELLELAKKENVEISEDEIKALLNTSNTNNELSDEELENVTGGTCYSSCTYEELGITPDYPQLVTNHPVITTAGNMCSSHNKRGFWEDCTTCTHHHTISPTIYCKIRSKENGDTYW